jgi:hypothetical protein
MLLGLAAVTPPLLAVGFGGLTFALSRAQPGAALGSNVDAVALLTLLAAMVGLLVLGPAVAVSLVLLRLRRLGVASVCQVSEDGDGTAIKAMLVPDGADIAPFA